MFPTDPVAGGLANDVVSGADCQRRRRSRARKSASSSQASAGRTTASTGVASIFGTRPRSWSETATTGDPAVRVALTRRRDALRKALGVVRAAADLARRGAGADDVETWVDSADGPGPH